MSASPFDPSCLRFPENLPVSARRDDIAAALAAHPVVIVCGETGSGKTTQLPKIALAAGRGRIEAADGGRIGMTQPRRIAARSVAQRIAQETDSELGGLVGWQVRFTDQVGPQSRIKVMTDGILLAETQSDPEFRAYDTLILDEAHERSLNIDFLLGYLKTLLPRRPGLKLVISSATLEAERFSAYFGGAPVVEVSGRTYPVEIRYRPPASTREKREDAGAPPKAAASNAADSNDGLDLALLHAVDELAAEGPGDILVFLPGEREIREAMEDLRKHHPPHTEILPLFARLSVAEQERVFAPHGGRRIVLSTNVAETSLTVPGIRYVVDAGLARVKRYSIRNKVEQLKVEKVSRAAANQRAGRCGRVAAGVCVRLYDEADFLSRPAYTTPELLRSSLAGVILRMKSLHLPEIDVFPFLDAPEPKRIRDGLQLLIELGALEETGPTSRPPGSPKDDLPPPEDGSGFASRGYTSPSPGRPKMDLAPSGGGSGVASRGLTLTDIGRQLARLPLDPRIGRMLIAARERAVLHEVLVIAAFLSVQDPRERPLEAQQAADEKHRRFADPNSDFVAILNLWRHADQLNSHRKSRKRLYETLRAEFLSPNRMREWRDVYGQLAVQVKELGWQVTPPSPATATSVIPANAGIQDPAPDDRRNPGEAAAPVVPYAALHQALLPGLLGNLGMLTEDGQYLGARDLKFLPFPGSGVKKKPKWIVAAELVDTRRLYARTVARVEPEWIEHCARHLLKLSYSDPHWAKKPAHVSAALRATLYGLPVVNARPVHYGPIDPALSRELFIRGALVAGDWDCRAPFFAHNRQLLDEVEDLAQRTRNARLAVDEHAVYAFFDARVPAGLHNGAAFEKWRRDAEKADPRLLYLTREALLGEQAQPHARDYPAEFTQNGARFALSYRFDPGHEADGVTLRVPLAALNQIDPAACEWLAPGLLEDKIAALIKSLPQGIRRAFVPVPDYARAAKAALLPQHPAAAEANPRHASLTDALAAFLTKATGQPIPRDAWRPEALAPHLVMRYSVEDVNGKVLAHGRDLIALRQQFGAQASAALTQAASASPQRQTLERERVQRWDFGPLPDSVPLDAPRPGSPQSARLNAFPALQVGADGPRLTLLDTPAAARAAHGPGVAQLAWLSWPDLARQTERDLGAQLKAACLSYGLLFKGSRCDELVRQVMLAAALSLSSRSPGSPKNDLAPLGGGPGFAGRGQSLAPHAETTRDEPAFNALCTALRPKVAAAARELAQAIGESLAAAQRLTQALDKAGGNLKTPVADLRAQLQALVFPGFVLAHPPERLKHLPRYLKAMELRLGKLPQHLARDLGHLHDLGPLLTALQQHRPTPAQTPALTEYRWLLEELRVSLFAQELKTPHPVSVKRLEKRWAEIKEMG